MTQNNSAPAASKQVLATLKEAQFRALLNGFSVALKFSPRLLVVHETMIFSDSTHGEALAFADFSPLIEEKLSFAISPDKVAIKKASYLGGGSDIRIIRDHLAHQFIFEDDHMPVSVKGEAMPETRDLTIPNIADLGVALKGYNTQRMRQYIGKQSGAVRLLVYESQLEQIQVDGSYPSTFTAGMAQHLQGRRPDVVLESKVGFRFFGKKQSIQIGLAGQDYILKVVNSLDIGVDLVVLEHLAQI